MFYFWRLKDEQRGRRNCFKIQDVTSEAVASASRPSDKLHQTRYQYKWCSSRKATPSKNALSIAWGSFQSCWGAAYTRHNWAHYQSIGLPVVLVNRKDGSTRLCVDYRRLNELSKKGSCPKHNAWCLIRFDLVLKPRPQSGCWQVKVEEENRELTTFSLRQMGFGSLRLTFGLCSAHFSS